ncbi:MAG: DUF4214 domain-containing protein [Fimbriiglobus sp.]|jgi:hypothetical protein|nr:DUF4214 domain-containing protein [Fimbriiglobus sp.]
MRYRGLTLSLIALTLNAVQSSAQQPDPAVFVRDLYRRYAGIDPDRGTVEVWVRELNRGTPPVEVHAQILGSNQTFERVRRDNATWVRTLYTDVLGREPEPDGLRHWLRRLEELRNDRVKLAREFLKSAGAELNAGGANRPGVIAPADLPAHLNTTAAVLAQSVGGEFPGFQHFMVRSQAENFARSVASGQNVLNAKDRFPVQWSQTVRSLADNLESLERGIAQTRLPAPNTRVHLDQCKQLIAAIAQGTPLVPPDQPGPPLIGGGGPLSRDEARRFRQLLEDLSRELTAAEATFRAVVPQNWSGRQLVAQVDAVHSDVDHLRSEVRAGFGRADLAARLQAINQSGAVVTKTIGSGQTDVRAVQAWYSVGRATQAVLDELGAVAVLPGQPGGGRVPAQAFRAIDQAVAECDALAMAFTPYTTYHRGVARLIADLQDLKNRYAALRQTAAGFAPSRRELDAHIDAIAERQRSVSHLWREVSRDPRLRNVPDLNDLNAADRDVTRQISAVR